MLVKIREFEQLFEEDLRLITLIREIDYGTIELTIRNGKPVVVKKALKTIKLDDN